MMPSLKRTKNQRKRACKGTKGRSTSKNDEATHPTIIRTPSPFHVISDLIDATCHEILSLQGDDGADSIPSVTNFAVLAQRLDYYYEQLSTAPDTFPEDPHTRTRILLAKLVLDICVRSAYPSDDNDAEAASQEMPPLIEMTEEQWSNLYRELGMVANNQSLMGSDDVSVPLASLICQVEAFGALAKLRSQLQSAIEEIDEDDLKSPSKKAPPNTFSFINGHVEEYKTKAEEINGKIESIDKNLFVPNAMLIMKRFSTFQRVKESAQSIVAGIEELVDKRVFPLNYMQTSLWELLPKMEKNLPVPKLFQVGYFNDGSSAPVASAASPASRLKSSEATTPVSPSAASSNGHTSSRNVKRKAAEGVNYADADDISSDSDDEESSRKKKEVEAGKENETSEFDFAPDDDDNDEEKVDKKEVEPEVKKKKRKRIPYSDEEKNALLAGVEEFGKGSWRKIRDHYADIFDVNKRTTVNLKDLHRTLTK